MVTGHSKCLSKNYLFNHNCSGNFTQTKYINLKSCAFELHILFREIVFPKLVRKIKLLGKWTGLADLNQIKTWSENESHQT